MVWGPYWNYLFIRTPVVNASSLASLSFFLTPTTADACGEVDLQMKILLCDAVLYLLIHDVELYVLATGASSDQLIISSAFIVHPYVFDVTHFLCDHLLNHLLLFTGQVVHIWILQFVLGIFKRLVSGGGQPESCRLCLNKSDVPLGTPSNSLLSSVFSLLQFYLTL